MPFKLINRNSFIQKKQSSSLFNFIDELKEKCSIDNIYFSTEKENKSYFRHKKHNNIKRDFNGLSNVKKNFMQISNFKKQNSDNNYLHNYNRKPLSSIDNIQNIKRNNSFKMEIENEKERRIYTNCKLEFYDELTNKIYRIKKFKETELPFTSSKILPEIEWQDLDNDILTEDEQIKSSKKKELNWIGKTIELIKKNDNYLKENLKKYKIKNTRKKH